MKISATVFVILILTYLVNASVLDPVIENVVHLKASHPPNSVPGIWKKKTLWKPRWVKEWKSAKVMKPVWRKVWSPVQIREWVPVPKPPPGWDSTSTPLIPIHSKPQKALKSVKDSVGDDSFTVKFSKTPLWDPIPYPESQQPPPRSFPQPLHVPCGEGGCDNSPSQTFNHQQISEIIGTRYQTPEYYQNPEFSETVNHLTRLPPDGNNWRPPQPLPDFQFDNRFNNFQDLPEFLVPPKFQFQPQTPTTPKPTVPPWIPLPPENKLKGHFITKAPDQPHSIRFPDVETKNNTNVSKSPEILEKPRTDKIHPQPNGDFIQEAQLVGEYHYSEFDLPNFKLQPVDTKEEVKTQQERVQKFKANQPVVENKQKQTVDTREQVKTQQERGQKPKIYQPAVENKQKQTEIHTTPHVQKKHIPNQISTNSHFLQEVKEIFPIYKSQNTNPDTRIVPNTFLLNHFSTKLQPIEQNSNSTLHIQPQRGIPHNHRFTSPSEIKNQIYNHNTTENNFKPEKNNTVQIVFATTPLNYNQPTEKLKSTTTEPYEIIFSSSLLATTEAATRSSVIIVTPSNSNENS